MVVLHPQFMVDANGTRTGVVLPPEEYDQLLEELEMLDDVAAYDRAKAEGGESVPYDVVRRELGLPE